MRSAQYWNMALTPLSCAALLSSMSAIGTLSYLAWPDAGPQRLVCLALYTRCSGARVAGRREPRRPRRVAPSWSHDASCPRTVTPFTVKMRSPTVGSCFGSNREGARANVSLFRRKAANMNSHAAGNHRASRDSRACADTLQMLSGVIGRRWVVGFALWWRLA